jgi:hypothetical protein
MLNKKRKASRLAKWFAVGIVAWCSASPVRASLVTYTLTGTVSGSITVGNFTFNPGSVGSLVFTDSPFTVTATGDSGGVTEFLPGALFNNVGFSVNVADVGTLTPNPTPPGTLLLDQGNFGPPGVEIESGNAPGNIAGCQNPAFNTWNGFSPLAVPCSAGGFGDQSTVFGFLYVTSSVSSEFTATSPASTPEPELFVVCGLGVGVLLAIAHRRQRRAL